jgi:microtubule-associated serine/threonine kinase
VYLARHIASNEQVAIKMLKKKDVLAKNLISQVMHERDIMHFAQNPFLINLICSFSSKV